MNSFGEISFSDVSFAFDRKQIIASFSELIASGEHVCIMGESGVGKSTLLNSIVGLTFPESGKIKVAGLEMNASNIQLIRSSVTWLPQNIHFPYHSVLEMMKAPYEFEVNKHLAFDTEKCLSLFLQTGLDASFLDKEMSMLSGGEKQRLLLVSALMLERKILLLDEPTSALDTHNRDKLILLLDSLKETTILAITHDDIFAQSMNRVITLKKAK